jgi:hypothetical protein
MSLSYVFQHCFRGLSAAATEAFLIVFDFLNMRTALTAKIDAV